MLIYGINVTEETLVHFQFAHLNIVMNQLFLSWDIQVQQPMFVWVKIVSFLEIKQLKWAARNTP